jgi:L,D-transpeptidase catalytic domain/Putative peptidoglycan binding domain
VLLWPAAGSAAPDEPALTLKAPRATHYGHRIDFVGRLTPSVPGAPIRLYRGGGLVAVSQLRGDGTFRIPVRVAQPGPFRVGWAGTFSPSVTVRIYPVLKVRVVGTRVVGKPLAVTARLRPATAGALRIRVVRSGRQTLVRLARGVGRVRLGTSKVGSLSVLVDTRPAHGYVSVSQQVRLSVRPPLLEYGSVSPAVAELLRRLAALHYAIPGIQTTFDGDVQESVYAFEKVQGLPRTGVADAAFWKRLDEPVVPKPRHPEPAAHIEVDKARQVLLLVRDGQVVLISPVSTAGIAGYYTPVGRFAIYRKVPGYDPSPLGILYKPMYFVGGYAIHGNPSVPPYPASHGCIRVPNFVIERLYPTQPYGETVYVY